MHTPKLCRGIAGYLLLTHALLLPQLPADVITLVPAHDTSLIQVQPNRNNGGEAWFLAGTTQNGTRNRGLLQFDLSGIPANAIITSASLSIEVTRVPGCGFSISSFSLHRMLVSWGEGGQIAIDNNGGQGAPAAPGEATWNNRFFGGAAWSAPGGAADADFTADPSASAFIYGTGDSPYDFNGPMMLADVQDWLYHPQSNFGWMFLSDDEITTFTARRFGSREDPNAWPQLTIQFEPVPEPGTMALVALGLAALTLWRAARPYGVR